MAKKKKIQKLGKPIYAVMTAGLQGKSKLK